MILDPSALEKLTLFAALHPEQDVFYSGVIHFGSVNGTCADQFDRERLLRENFLTVSCLFRREHISKLGDKTKVLSMTTRITTYGCAFSNVITQGCCCLSLCLSTDAIQTLGRREPALLNPTKNGWIVCERAILSFMEAMPLIASNWKLMKPDGERKLPITEDFSAIYRNSSGLRYES